MPDITKHIQPPTVQAIYRHYEKSRSSGHRSHLGGSQIGHACDRYLWYQFHWCESPSFDGRMLRLFAHGDVEEGRLVADLRAIGVTVYDVDPDTSKQWWFPALGGHFSLSLDGVAVGFAESSKWHSLEFKTTNDKGFKVLKKDGVQKAKPQHYAQMQIGMELADLDRAYYLAVNKNTDEIHGERLKREHKEGERLLKRAERIIFSEDPLERISERPDWYECKFCDMYAICHQGKTAETNCRTCLHSTAERDGTWSCARHKKTLDYRMQRAGCAEHLYRPELVGKGKAVDAGDDWVLYEGPNGHFRNGPRDKRSYTSAEIRAAEAVPLDDEAEAMRMEFDGEVVG